MGATDFSKINQTLGDILARASNPEPALNEIGQLGVGEMKTNIEQGGRPEKWEPSQRVKKHGGQTLRLSGNLMNSISFVTGDKTVSWGPGGRASAYAAIQNFGGMITRYAHSELFIRTRGKRGEHKGQFRKGTSEGKGMTMREYTIVILSRPYDYVSPEAQQTFGDIMTGFILGV